MPQFYEKGAVYRHCYPVSLLPVGPFVSQVALPPPIYRMQCGYGCHNQRFGKLYMPVVHMAGPVQCD